MSSITAKDRLSSHLAELDQTTDWERRPRGGMRVDLQPMLDLAQRLGNPHKCFRSVHVAGTKGKGSTCALIEAGLVRAGVAVGRYGSPHVTHITERVSLNGQDVSEEILADALGASLRVFKEAKRAATSGANATWFDILTVSAFMIFRSQRVEWAVIETGLGGRLDSTNIVQSDVAIVTNVELEHTEVLGGTRAIIALEKAGIIKRNSVVITPLSESDEAGAVVTARAAELASVVKRPNAEGDLTIQDRNVRLAGAVLKALGAMGVTAFEDGQIRKPVGSWLLDLSTLQAAQLPGRFERLVVNIPDGKRNINVVLDGAHVPFSLAAVLADLSKQDNYRTACIVVMSIAEDKDAVGLISSLDPRKFSIIFTTVGARSRPPDELKTIADAKGIESVVMLDPILAYRMALQRAAQSGGWVLVTGTLYLTGLIREL